MSRRRFTARLGAWLLTPALMMSGGIAAAAQETPGSTISEAVPEGLREVVEPLLPAPAGTISKVGPEIEPAALVYWNRTIVVFRAQIGSSSPDVRAAVALSRLDEMSENDLRGEVKSRQGELDGLDVALVTVNDRIVLALVAGDLPPLSQQSLEALAAETVSRLGQALAARREQRRWRVLLEGLAYSLLATLLMWLLIYGGTRLFRVWQHWLGKSQRLQRKARFLDLDIGSQLLVLLRMLVVWVARLLAAAVVYAWLTYVLSRFPYTEPWSNSLGHWMVATLAASGRAVVGALPGLATVVLIFAVARVLARLLGQLLRNVEDGTIEIAWIPRETARGARCILVAALWVLAFALAYPFIPGSSTGTFKGVSVLLGLMLTMASAGLVNHLLAGWVILFSRGLRVGDYVRIGEHEGRVLQLGVLATKIMTRRREVLTLPNAVVTAAVTTNYSQNAASGACIAAVAVTIGYDAPWRQVHAMLLEAATRTPGVHADPPPHVVQSSLGDFYVEYELNVEVDLLDRPKVLSALRANIQDVFNEHGVQIMSPHFVGQPGTAVVVPRDHWFDPPARKDEPGGTDTGRS